MRYLLTDAAVEDVREIARHVHDVQKSPQNARLVVQRLKATFRKLATYPKLGHVRD